MSVDLGCFVNNKTDPVALTQVFVLTAEKPVSLSVADIKLVPKGAKTSSVSGAVAPIDCN